MNKKLYRPVIILLLSLVILILFNIQLISYGISQLTGQLRIIYNSVSIDEVLNSKEISIETKEKLIYIDEVRRYAMDSLGLKNSKNYTTFFDQKDKPVMWVVTGCLPYELKAKSWWFPVIGNVTYKGFFVEEKAKAEEEKIRREGYETNIYSPSAWSTLGYFTDPILSNMLKRGPGSLADLVIHELTHATVYLKSSVDFNENFATFVGERGAEKFLENKFGPDSDELKRYKGFLDDDVMYSNYMLSSARQLDSLYNTFSDDTEIREKARLKFSLIAQIMAGINHLPHSYPHRYGHDFKTKPLPNNTEFMSFLRYRKNLTEMQRVYEEMYKSDLRFFIEDIVSKSEKNEPLPFEID